MSTSNRLPAREGFTLFELIFSTAIAALLVLGVLRAYAAYSRSYGVRSEMSTVQQRVRKAMDMISQDLRHAGYGIPAPYTNLPNWVTWVAGITNPVMVVQGTGTNDPDTLIITGATDAPVSSLRVASMPGDTVLNIQTGDESLFNTTDRKMIYIGRLETARITGIASGAITVSRNPLTSGVGLVNGYPVGAPIELVTVTTYDLAPATTNFPGVPYLRRYLNSATPPVDVARGIAALHIDSFRLEERPHSTIQTWVQGRTAKPDRQYSHPSVGDPYRRVELRSTLLVRNTP